MSGYATTSDVNAKQDKITTANPLSSSLVSGLKTKLSEFTNDSNFITNSALSGYATTSALNAKQDAITSSNIGTVIVDNLSSGQKAALNSGVTSSTVSTVSTNASSISSLETTVGKTDSTGLRGSVSNLNSWVGTNATSGLRGTVATLGTDLQTLENSVNGDANCQLGRGGTDGGTRSDFGANGKINGTGGDCTLSLEARIAAIEAWINAQ